jgi:rRNA maturation endonuclease Nob1
MCGVFEHGVARFRCEACTREHLVPFSCKGRGWCPSCGGRLRLIATLHDPAVIRKILAHLALCHSGHRPSPAPPESGAAAS